jgi:integrase
MPVLLTENEVALVLALLDGVMGLMLRLISGSGLRVSECMRLRVKDYFERNQRVPAKYARHHRL